MKYKLLAGVLLTVGLLGCPDSEKPSVSKNPPKAESYDITKQSIEENAPDFTLKNLQGEKVKLSDYKGKVVLLVFSTTWCPHCRAEIPHLKKLYAEYQKKGLVLLNIDIQESQAKVSSFAKKNEIPYPVLLDKDGQVGLTYGIRGVPTTVLINKEGIILCKVCRSLDTLLEKLIDNK